MSFSPFAILRNHFRETRDVNFNSAAKAVALEDALKREGFTIVSNEVAAAIAAIVAYGNAERHELQLLLMRLGLAEIVPFDPEKHDAGGAEIEPGSDYLQYAPALVDVLRFAKPHLRGALN